MPRTTKIMKKFGFLSIVLLCAGLLLAGCLGPKTPQEVAKAFWQAVIEQDNDEVAEYSTLDDPKTFNGFGMQWQGVKPVWGKVVIDGDQAAIETRFSGLPANDTSTRQCVTYLVRKDGVWKVDYARTGNDLQGGAIGALFGSLNQLGNTISKTLDASEKALNVEMQQLGRKLQAMSDQFSQQAGAIIEKHVKELQDIMQQLQDSINRALQDKKNHLSDQDRQTMTQVSGHLNNSSAALANPTTKSVSYCNDAMGTAQQQLDSIDGGLSDDYKQQWLALEKQFQSVMQQMLDELANSVKNDNQSQ